MTMPSRPLQGLFTIQNLLTLVVLLFSVMSWVRSNDMTTLKDSIGELRREMGSMQLKLDAVAVEQAKAAGKLEWFEKFQTAKRGN